MPSLTALAGEIHSDWRERIAGGVEEAGLPVRLTHPVTDHPASDDCGVEILGAEDDKFWHDHKGAGINAIRTGTLLREADLVVVRFGEQYKQWNAAFDAGQAAALGTPLITLHPPEPIQESVQKAKYEPLAGTALKVTTVFAAKAALHVPGQLIPDGALVTAPLPPMLTVRL